MEDTSQQTNSTDLGATPSGVIEGENTQKNFFKSPKTRVYLSIFIVVVVVFTIGYIVLRIKSSTDDSIVPSITEESYVIPNVPILSWYSDEIINSKYRGTGVGSLITLLRYWGEDVSVQDEDLYQELSALFETRGGYRGKTLKNYFDQRGYHVDEVYLRTSDDFRKYINEEKRVPLFFSQPADELYPDLIIQNLLIGIGDKNDKIILNQNEFAFGYTREVSFDEFNALWDLMDDAIVPTRAEGRQEITHLYYAIWPKDSDRVKRILEKPITDYPPRLAVMNTARPVLLAYLAGVQEKNPLQKVTYFNSAIEHPNFSDIHPLFQILLHSFLVREEILLDDIESASKHIDTLVSTNTNLDRQYGTWPRYNFDQISHPFFTLARYYEAIGEEEKVVEWRDGGRSVEKKNFGISGPEDPYSPWYDKDKQN